MNFTVLPENLKAAYTAVKQVIEKKSSLPILDNVLFTPSSDGKSFTLTGSDADGGIVVAPLALESADGLQPFIIDAATLGDYIKDGIDVWPIDISIDNRGEVTISDQTGDFHFMTGGDAKEYPIAKEQADPFVVSVPAKRLSDTVAAALPYTGSDNFRPIMSGVYLDFQADGLRVAASDTKKLYRDIIREVQSSESHSVVLSKKIIGCLSMLDQSKDVTVSFDQTTIRFRQDGGAMVGGQLIEGRYPRYDAVIPKNNDKVAVFDRQLLASSVRRAMLCSNASTRLIELSFDDTDRVTISAQDVDYSRNSKTFVKPVSLSVGDLKVGFRAPYLLDVLNTNKDSKEVAMLLSDGSHAVLVKPSVDADRVSLIMPMALTD